jgi:hypothetical protein
VVAKVVRVLHVEVTMVWPGARVVTVVTVTSGATTVADEVMVLVCVVLMVEQGFVMVGVYLMYDLQKEEASLAIGGCRCTAAKHWSDWECWLIKVPYA